MQKFAAYSKLIANPVVKPFSPMVEMKTTTSAPPDIYAGPDMLATTALEPFEFGPASKIDTIAVDTEPQMVVNPIKIVEIVAKVIKGAIDLAKLIKDLNSKPKLDIGELLEYNLGLLVDIEEDITVLQEDLDAVLEGIDGLTGQLNLNLIGEVRTEAFNLLDKIRDFDSPSQAQFDEIVGDGSDLINTAEQAVGSMLGVAPANFIASQMVPTLMLAAAARTASVDYASDKGLGEYAVREDINFVKDTLHSIYARGSVIAQPDDAGPVTHLFELYDPNGALEQAIVAESSFESFLVTKASPGGIYRFAIIETISRPDGTVVHNVAADHTYAHGEALGWDFTSMVVDVHGSINGKEGAAALEELASIKVDHVVGYDPDHVSQLNDGFTWIDGSRIDLATEFMDEEMSNLGDNDFTWFLGELPSTFGATSDDWGGPGDDSLEGTQGSSEVPFSAPDHIEGKGGDDTLKGFGDNDALFGDGGSDSLYGGAGNDNLFGGNSNDRLFGDEGHDRLEGEGGRDTLEGGAGNDILFQSERGDFLTHDNPDEFTQNASSGGRLEGNSGNDLLVGDNGGDDLDGGTGHDSLYGYDGEDALIGGAGNDLLLGGDGADTVLGGGGDDTVEGGAGDDEISGSWGDDMITGGGGDDVIAGGYGIDTAVYYGDFEDYEIAEAPNGTWFVTDLRTNPVDGTDTIVNDVSTFAIGGGNSVEYLQFDDKLLVLTPVPCGGADGTQLVLNTGSAPEPGDHECEIDDFKYMPVTPSFTVGDAMSDPYDVLIDLAADDRFVLIDQPAEDSAYGLAL